MGTRICGYRQQSTFGMANFFAADEALLESAPKIRLPYMLCFVCYDLMVSYHLPIPLSNTHASFIITLFSQALPSIQTDKKLILRNKLTFLMFTIITTQKGKPEAVPSSGSISGLTF